MTRKYDVDVIKFVFAVFVALGHMGFHYISSSIIVDCFFAMSGYFLVRSYDSGKYSSAFAYSKNRVSKLYLQYLVAFGMFMLYTLLYSIKHGTVETFISGRMLKMLPELLFLQNTGIFAEGGLNDPLWQLSVLIIASHLIFALLNWNRNLAVSFLAPILALWGSAYFSNAYGAYETNWWGVEVGFLAMPIVRGLTMLSIGVALYEIINHLASVADKSWHSATVSCLELFFLGYYIYNNDSFHGVLAFLCFFTCVLSGKGLFSRLFNRPIFHKCESWSLLIYMNHALVIRICGMLFQWDFSNTFVVIPVYLGIVFLYSFAIDKGIFYIRQKRTTGKTTQEA